jgi:exosome complex RNA-binding protein Rrp42 (RNase PH superfamily)
MQENKGLDLDMMAAEAGENYLNLHSKIHCLEATGNVFSIAFMECIKRTSHLSTVHFNRIMEMTRELAMQEGDDFVIDDPSFLPDLQK